jgi:hypothetical protein
MDGESNKKSYRNLLEDRSVRRTWLPWGLLVVMGAALTEGCGRPTLPGHQFSGEQVETSVAPESNTPLPKEPFFEAGPASAKVRIVAFFPIDDEHAEVVELLKGLVGTYSGKVYLKYVDPRTPEGYMLSERAEMQCYGLLINNESEIQIEAEPNPYQVIFVQDMGRYWTREDLELAVAQAVARPSTGEAEGQQ